MAVSWVMHPPGSSHPRPFAPDFYHAVREHLRTASVRISELKSDSGGHVIDVAAGELLTISLVEGPQIVNLFMFNSSDPDERYWAHETYLIESLFLTRYTRLWGTMARFRPLLTLIDDTVVTLPTSGVPTGARHHVAYGDWGTPLEWRLAGGPSDVLTTWEQFARAYESLELKPSLLMDYACLFQKSAIDGPSQRLDLLPSDALIGDSVTFFSEIDLRVVMALSPLIDGSRPPSALAGAKPHAIRVSVTTPVAIPLPWPYSGMDYPDLSLYLDSAGVRSTDVIPTPGLDYDR